MKNKKKGKLLEIFSSIQGEGLYVGQRQIFLRFAECNLECVYCDLPPKTRVQSLSCKEVIDKVERLSQTLLVREHEDLPSCQKKAVSDRQPVISLTGGEPLCQVDFLLGLLPELKGAGYRIYLETNGTLAKSLTAIINWIDIISMDLKLPSATRSQVYWKQHIEFLEVVRDYKSPRKDIEIFTKVIVTRQTKRNDFKKAVDILRNTDYKIPLVIQPVWPTTRMPEQISSKRLLEFESLASQHLDEVRIIPQVHKILGVR